MGIAAASRLCLADMVRKHARAQPAAVALTDGQQIQLSYAELSDRVDRLAGALQALGLARGDRLAVLSENCVEYIELELAAAQLGLIVACLNWRLADDELAHCIRLVTPKVALVSARFAPTLARLDHGVPRVIALGAEFDALRHAAPPVGVDPTVDPEDGLVILYTSGTTGLPKGALISQRALVARAQVYASTFGITGNDAFIAWSPLFHMAATDHALATLLLGGKVIVHDGLNVARICAVLEQDALGWLVAMPGMIETLINGLKAHQPRIRSLRAVGAMADLVPPHQIAELTRLIGAPYVNSFGSTETGVPPASGALLAPGVVPTSLSKRESVFCQVRLVDADDREVGLETPGEMTVRGPTLFSGYWSADATNAQDFRGGWFHLGDMFVRHADGTLDFVDRLKYMIKSGGENIYPAEIERVLLAHPSVRDAAVVRQRDDRWGEVPVAFVAAEPGLTEDVLMAWCHERLSHYKRPRSIRFVMETAFPRSSTGKIQRHEIERQWL